ncbi:unnamed protein product [Angiostrongylus costaricensis]|uniref:G-patch domain-containing protein n=1 Tax=Angiostrongylus costaricensis TaxID=334426 RepID=A0A0R3PXI0_ANGCS|nr:unnamed protein product [Angiostrongylus costaricensis]
MIELRPPMVMPRGNVGTSTQYFMEQIRLCRLPPSLISKLGLKTTRRNRKYGSVAFHYTQEGNVENALSTDPTDKILEINFGPDNDDGPDDDDDQCEEWERHESLHDDVTEQERIKPRKYEEEMEIIWEKGGPGLVWYTDKNYWDEREKGTDCDWAWADDWDVDYSVYYEGKSAGTMDARDAIEIREDELLQCIFRSPLLPVSSVLVRANWKNLYSLGRKRTNLQGGASEVNYSEGRRLLDLNVRNLRMGWKPGSGLGRLHQGRVDPVAIQLEEDGQTGVERIGFGYRGEKMQRTGFRKIPRIHAIASRFDAATDKIETSYKRVGNEPFGDILFRRSELTKMKYRPDSTSSNKK